MQSFKPQMKNILKKCTKCANKLVALLSAVVVTIVLIFLYNNFYQTVVDANVLLKLKDQVALEMIDMERWDKINKEIDWKKQPLAEEGLAKNPFK